MAKLATLVDTFSGTLSLWTASQTSIVSGRARLAPTIAAGNYDPPATLVSATTYDLTESEIVFELPTPPGLATVEHWFQCYVGPDANNKVGLFFYCDATTRSIEFKRFVAGVGTNVATTGFDSTNHKWFKISMASGVVHWWTSPDGSNWTEQGSGWTSTITLTASSVNFAVSGERTPGNIEIDNVNNGGSGSPPPSADISDTFATQDTTKWTWKGTAGVASGNLELPPTNLNSAIALNNGILSNGVISLTDTPVYLNLVGYPTTIAASTFATLYVALSTSQTAITNAITFQVPMSSPSSTDYEAHTYVSGVDTAAYLSDIPAWFRITRDTTNIYWQSSTDGITWNTVHTVAASSAPATTALYVHLYAKGDPTNTGSFKIASINTSPGSPPAASGIADTFATKDLTKWTWQGTAGVNAGNLEVIPNSMTPSTLNWIKAQSTIDLNSEDFLVEVTGFPTSAPADGSFMSLYLILSTSATVEGAAPANAMLFRLTANTADNNNVQAESYTAGVAGTVGYPYTTDRWFRIKKVGSNVEWQTSANGDTAGTWTTVLTTATASLPALTALYAHIGAYGSAVNTTPYMVGSVNTPPGSPVATVPGAVSSFTATPGDSLLDLAWTAPASNGGSAITSYVLQQTAPTIGTAINLGPTVLAYQATGLTPGTSYTFSVLAKNAVGNGPATSASGVPTAAASGSLPNQPTSVTATAGSAAASLTWTAPSTPNGTILGYRVIDHNGTTVATTTGTGTSTTATGLVNGVPYFFQVIARNATGEGPASVASNTVTPFASGSSSSFLSLRSSFGALPGSGGYASLESSVGRVMQPVAYNYRLGDTFPLAEIATIGRRDRSPLLLLDTSGMAMSAFLSGNRDSDITALGSAIDATNRYVYVAPFFAPNDLTKPWSPFYTPSSPGYDASLSMDTVSMSDLNIAFRNIARLLRAASPYARLVWSVSVEPQPTSAADQWASFHPGPAADIVMLVGRNHGVGPAQGLAGQTSWKTPAQIFDTPYAALDAVADSQTPFWLWTACHDPATAFAPVGPGFAPGASVPVDSANSKADWIDLLMESTSWPRTSAVVWENVQGTRNWPITSSTASNTAIRSHLADQDGWARTEVQHDQLGDHVRERISSLAKWARSGALPAEEANLYDRPDARSGVRVNLIHSTPYSQGPKTSATVNAVDMLAWNKLHGLILRQIGRYGMQGWAWASGTLPRDHSSLIHTGTTTTVSSVNYVALTADYDALPGPAMQREAGMVDAFAGVPAPILSDLPDFTFTDVTDTTVTITFTAPTGIPASAILGYTFSAEGPGAFTPMWVSTPPSNPAGNVYTFTNLVGDTTYEFGVAAHTAQGEGVRKKKSQKTDPAPVTPPPSGSGLPTKVTGIYWETWGTPERIIDLPTSYNVIYLFQAIPDFLGATNGNITFQWPGNQTQAAIAADVQTCRARGQRVLLSVGGADWSFNLADRTASQTFLADFNSYYAQFGGLDGIDLNNFELASGMNTTEWIFVLQSLRSTHGSNFIIAAPPTASYGKQQIHTDAAFLNALDNAGVLDFVAPQFYDSTDLTNQTAIDNATAIYVNAGIPWSKMGLGFRVAGGGPVWTPANAATAYTTTKAAHPELRGGFNFSAQTDPTDAFATTVNPVILA